MKEFLSGLICPVTGIIDKVVADKNQAARLAHDIATMADRHAQAMLAQVAVSQAEAKGNWFQPARHPLCGYNLHQNAVLKYATLTKNSMGVNCLLTSPHLSYPKYGKFPQLVAF